MRSRGRFAFRSRRRSRSSAKFAMTRSKFAPTRTASKISFVPPSIETIRRVRPESRIIAIDSSVISVPFVITR